MHPRAKATSPTGTPGPGPRPLPQQALPNRHPKARPQQWLSMGFQSCRKPSKTLQTLQTLQNPLNPPNTVPSRHPRSTAMTFLRLSKLPFASPQKLQPHLPQQAPQGQATAMAFYGLSKLPFASPQTLQNSPNAPNPPKPAKPSKHRPQQAPQIYSNDFLAAFKAAVCQPAKAATPPSPTGTPRPGHSNGFLWAFKAAVCQPANPLKLSKRSKPSKTRQTLQTPSPAGTPDPQQ